MRHFNNMVTIFLRDAEKNKIYVVFHFYEQSQKSILSRELGFGCEIISESLTEFLVERNVNKYSWDLCEQEDRYEVSVMIPPLYEDKYGKLCDVNCPLLGEEHCNMNWDDHETNDDWNTLKPINPGCPRYWDTKK